jgi:hypothetical protein
LSVLRVAIIASGITVAIAINAAIDWFILVYFSSVYSHISYIFITNSANAIKDVAISELYQNQFSSLFQYKKHMGSKTRLQHFRFTKRCRVLAVLTGVCLC